MCRAQNVQCELGRTASTHRLEVREMLSCYQVSSLQRHSAFDDGHQQKGACFMAR